MEWTGGCLCGAITYRAWGELLDVASCHCVNCRRMSGAVYATFVVFSLDHFEWTKGDITTYAATPDYQRGFCRECGSSVASWQASEADQWIAPWAGTLDQADQLKPHHHIHAKEILRTRERLNDILSKHTGQPLKRIQADTDRDRFMGGQEAVAYGLIDEVFERRGAFVKLGCEGLQ